MTTPNPTSSSTCPHCHQPLTPGVKFCETCGARIEQAPVCPHCGAPLTPGVRFCESCGKPVTPSAPVTVAPATVPVPEEPESPGPPSKPEEISIPEPEPEPVQNTLFVPGEPPVKPEPAPAQEPVFAGETWAQEPAEETPLPQPAPLQPIQEPASPSGAGSSSKTLIIAGIVGLLIIAAIAIFVVLPMLSGTSADGGNGAATDATVTAASTMPATTSENTAEAFETLTTQRLPVNLEVVYQVERSPVTGIVTVTFSGGSGLNGIASTLITVTRSDGQIMTKSWKPARIGDSVTVQGTTMTDRVEVITNFYNGDSYRCFDQVFEYKKRN